MFGKSNIVQRECIIRGRLDNYKQLIVMRPNNRQVMKVIKYVCNSNNVDA